MSNDPQRELGRLEAEVMNLKSDMDEVKGDVKLVLAKLNEDKGMFKAIGWGGTGIAAAAGALGGTIAKKLGLSILAVFVLLPLQAWAHDWMPHETRWCCDNRDCHPHPKSAVERTDEGWQIVSTGQVFKDGERGIYPNYAPDVGEVWICMMPHEAPKARCIFILPEGS